jgi:hypothetical protein
MAAGQQTRFRNSWRTWAAVGAGSACSRTGLAWSMQRRRLLTRARLPEPDDTGADNDFPEGT